jgi:type I restriction enzyme R subunit
MIGRGTRLRPDLDAPGEDKADVLVFDFGGNLEYFSQDLPAAEGTIGRSLSWRLFDARLRLLRALDTDDADPDLRASTAHSLHGIVAGMSLDNFLVRPQRRLVERYSNADAWDHGITEDQARDLLNLAGLPSELTDNDEAAKRFDLLMLRRQLADVEGDTASAEKIRKSVQAIAASLLTMTAIPTVKEQAVLLEEVAGDDWWVDVTLAMLESARTRLRGLVRFIEKTSQNPIYADFEDQLGDFTDVDLPGTTTGTDLKRFRTKAAAYLRQHEDQMALQKLRRNRQLTSQDIQELQRMLEESGIGTESDIVQAATQGGGLGLFIRSLVGLDRSAAQEAFAAFLDDGRFTVDQIRFVDLIVDELTQNGVMDAGRLFEAPYIDHAPTGPDYLFPRDEVAILVNTLNQVAAHALPQAVASR